jgi:23S rRNA pseudouridine2605 synthase
MVEKRNKNTNNFRGARKPIAAKRPERQGRAERPSDDDRAPKHVPRSQRATRAEAPVSEPAPRSGEPMRIAKAMARAGLCSRREAERWIADGRVSVNGKLLKTPACEVGPTDKVIVDGRPLPTAEPAKLWRYHKPRGLVTTHADPQGRPTVFEKMPPEMERVISIGRLDFNTEGLLLLTNDGGLARFMELPATGWVRRYRVRAKGRVTPEQLASLKNGLDVDGVQYGPVEASVDSVQGANMWLSIAIREGKNREVRKILAHLGVEVNRLIRVSFGPFQLLDLEPGAVEQVKRRVLAEQLGTKMAQDLGLSESPEDRKARHERGKAAARRAHDSDTDDA